MPDHRRCWITRSSFKRDRRKWLLVPCDITQKDQGWLAYRSRRYSHRNFVDQVTSCGFVVPQTTIAIKRPNILLLADYYCPGQTVLPTQVNSSQVTKSKLADRRVAKWYRQVEPAHKNHSIVAIRPHTSHMTTTKQLGKSWLTWPNGGKLGSSWAKIWAWSSSNNSSQLKPTRSGWPNDAQLHRSCELGSGWLELGAPFCQGLKRRVGGNSNTRNFFTEASPS